MKLHKSLYISSWNYQKLKMVLIILSSIQYAISLFFDISTSSRVLLLASIVLDILQKDYLFIQVPDEVLIDRCVGRRLDPVTGRIYHEKNFPPETEEIKARLVTRPDDTEEKVC